MVCDEDACGISCCGIRCLRPSVSCVLPLLLLHCRAGLHEVGHDSGGWGKVVELESEVQGLDVDWGVERIVVPEARREMINVAQHLQKKLLHKIRTEN